jgi:hypothetical protein
MFCRYCGTQNPDDSLYCKKCGKSIEEGTKEAVPPAEEPSPPAKSSPPKEKERSRLPIVLGITIPVITVLTIAALIFSGIIPFPLLNQESTETDSAEETETAVGDSNTQEEPQEEAQEPTQEEPEEILLEYYPECDLSFDEGNTFEISQEAQDLGYPHFTFAYPDGWEVEEIPEDANGYLIRFKNPNNVSIKLENGIEWDQPLLDERIYILNEEFQTMEPADIIDELWRPAFELEELEILTYDNIDDEIFFIIWAEPEGNTFWEHFRLSDINGKLFIHIVASIDYCYDPWSDVLINSAIDERMVIEEQTIAEHVEEETEGPQAVKPTLGLEVIEGPISEGGICYYRVAVNTGGSPSPNITFNRDDSNGAWGSDVSQVNLVNPDDSFTLTATASNSAGSATDSITLNWGCEVPKEEPRDEPKDEQGDEPRDEPEDSGVEKDCNVNDLKIISMADVSPGGSTTLYSEDGIYKIEVAWYDPCPAEYPYNYDYRIWGGASSNPDVEVIREGGGGEGTDCNGIIEVRAPNESTSVISVSVGTTNGKGDSNQVTGSVTITFYHIFID